MILRTPAAGGKFFKLLELTGRNFVPGGEFLAYL